MPAYASATFSPSFFGVRFIPCAERTASRHGGVRGGGSALKHSHQQDIFPWRILPLQSSVNTAALMCCDHGLKFSVIKKS